MKTIYIAGKISGLHFDDVVKKFAAAQTELEAQGYKVINPVEQLIQYNSLIRLSGGAALTEENNRNEILKIDIGMLVGCNAIYLLHDWMDSRGAAMEFHIANVLGMEIIAQDGREYCVEMEVKECRKVAG